jgi:hypothetical protein
VESWQAVCMQSRPRCMCVLTTCFACKLCVAVCRVSLCICVSWLVALSLFVAASLLLKLRAKLLICRSVINVVC